MWKKKYFENKLLHVIILDDEIADEGVFGKDNFRWKSKGKLVLVHDLNYYEFIKYIP